MCHLKYTVCRTCLETVEQSRDFNIFTTEDLAKKFSSCTGQHIEATDEYPAQLCQKCYDSIVAFYEFQQMCYKSLKTFADLLKAKQEKETDNLQHDVEKQNHLFQPANEGVVVVDREMATRSKSVKNKFHDQKFERKMVTKRSTSSPIRKNNESAGVAKDKTKNDLKEYLQFGKVNTAHEHIEIAIMCQESVKAEKGENFALDDVQLGMAMLKEEEIEQQKLEEIILTDGQQKRDPGPELVLVEKQGHQCNRCRLKFKTVFKLQAHVRQHDGLAPYLCSFEGCTCSFDRWHLYMKHQKDHYSREQNFKCDVDNCERVYKNKSNLNIHKRKFHHCGPELKTHMCEICGKVFKSSAVLNDHRFTHIDRTQLPHACAEEDCGKRFSTKEKLKIHKMRHAGIKNFVCPHCGMRKTTRNELKIHINYHTLERTWPCRFCPKVCNSAGNLKMHIKNIHEGAKDFACRYCQRTFAKADTKKYHEMTHTGEKPNKCNECGRRFVQPAALRTHRKIHLRQKEKIAEKQKAKTPTGHSDDTHLLESTLNDATTTDS